MDVQPYLADISGLNADSLLDDWWWLLGERAYTVYRATAMGDLFLRDAAGQFHLLDMIGGKVQPLAASEDQLWEAVGDRRARKEILLTQVVRGLKEAGVTLGPGECYSPDLPPTVGGDLSNTNLRPCDIRIHASIMGQIHRQGRDLPAGTRISGFREVGR
jgi:hypothetical protein